MTELRDIPVDQLTGRPDNLRQDANGDDLVASIQAYGILTPLNVIGDGQGGYTINAGHRRLDGALKAGLVSVPCMVDDEIDSDTHVAFAMLIENLQRADLTPVEVARGFKRLVDLGVKQKEIAGHIGVSTSMVSRRLTLLKLPDEALDRVHTGDLALETAEAYTKLDAEVVAIALAEDWDVWRVERSIEHAAAGKAREQRIVDETAERAALIDACETAGLPVVDDEPVWDRTPIEGDELHLWEPLQVKVTTVDGEDSWEDEVDEWVGSTPLELAAAWERTDVEAVTVAACPDDPRLTGAEDHKLRVILLHRVDVPAHLQGRGSGPSDDELKAAKARQKAEQKWLRDFLDDVASRKLKATDVARWAMLDVVVGASYEAKKELVGLLGMEPLDPETVERYAIDMAAGHQFPPLIAYKPSASATRVVLIGGNHRVAAATAAGRATLACYTVTAEPETVTVLGYVDNGLHGKPPSKAERVAQAAHLVETGHSQETAAAMLRVQPMEVSIYRKIARGSARAQELEVGGEYDGLATSTRRQLASIGSDPVYAAAIMLVAKCQMTAPQTEDLVRRIDRARGDDKALVLIGSEEEDRRVDLQQRAGRTKSQATRTGYGRAVAAINTLIGLDAVSVATSCPPAARDHLRSRLKDVAAQLVDIDVAVKKAR